MFITFEGSEGSGKTTQIESLAAHLRSVGWDVLTTRQPGGTLIGAQIRACIHDINNHNMTSETEILLYSADRAQHVGEVIQPALAQGKVVLCDRYADSTMAYQGYGRGLDLDTLAFITQFATNGLQPDLTLLLEVDVRVGLRRRTADSAEVNRMDLQKQAFYERVSDGYQRLIEQMPQRWVVIDANRSIAQIQQDIRRTVTERLGKTPSN